MAKESQTETVSVANINVAKEQMDQCGNLEEIKKVEKPNRYTAVYDFMGFNSTGLDRPYKVENVAVWKHSGAIVMTFSLTGYWGE